jgi:hypothetical protein
MARSGHVEDLESNVVSYRSMFPNASDSMIRSALLGLEDCKKLLLTNLTSEELDERIDEPMSPTGTVDRFYPIRSYVYTGEVTELGVKLIDHTTCETPWLDRPLPKAKLPRTVWILKDPEGETVSVLPGAWTDLAVLSSLSPAVPTAERWITQGTDDDEIRPGRALSVLTRPS